MSVRWPRPFYFLRRALRALGGAPVPALVSAATIAIAVFLLGAFLLTGENLRRLVVGWAGESQAVTVYARRDLGAGALDALERRIANLPEVSRVRRASPEQSFAELRATLGEDATILEGVEPAEVIGVTWSVILRPETLDPQSVSGLGRRLQRFPGVDSVESGALWLEHFSRVLRVGAGIAVGWALMLAGGAALIVSNTARLAALTRREEIEVLRLVGASDVFIVLPFFWEGVIQGLVGSALGLGLLFLVFRLLGSALAGDPFFVSLVSGLRFLEGPTLGFLAAAGPAIGGLGSLGSAMRFLRNVAL